MTTQTLTLPISFESNPTNVLWVERAVRAWKAHKTRQILRSLSPEQQKDIGQYSARLPTLPSGGWS